MEPGVDGDFRHGQIIVGIVESQLLPRVAAFVTLVSHSPAPATTYWARLATAQDPLLWHAAPSVWRVFSVLFFAVPSISSVFTPPARRPRSGVAGSLSSPSTVDHCAAWACQPRHSSLVALPPRPAPPLPPFLPSPAQPRRRDSFPSPPHRPQPPARLPRSLLPAIQPPPQLCRPRVVGLGFGFEGVGGAAISPSRLACFPPLPRPSLAPHLLSSLIEYPTLPSSLLPPPFPSLPAPFLPAPAVPRRRPCPSPCLPASPCPHPHTYSHRISSLSPLPRPSYPTLLPFHPPVCVVSLGARVRVRHLASPPFFPSFALPHLALSPRLSALSSRPSLPPFRWCLAFIIAKCRDFALCCMLGRLVPIPSCLYPNARTLRIMGVERRRAVSHFCACTAPRQPHDMHEASVYTHERPMNIARLPRFCVPRE
ncbi:hypothetical protein C8J57DRAFT_1576325 [Mycena rebaudengoi]|nr:hypothetical protein C8J57DRAFT_1576325 [Mycena rebaudengoi]